MYIDFAGGHMPGSVCRSLTWTHFEEKISNILPAFSDPYTHPCIVKILKLLGHVAKGVGYRYQEFQTFTIRESTHTNLSKLPQIYGINS